ncbi:hypothetical protein F5I97DRAFT_1830976 [Phlebopus sp. FC_14]|nr:hypothetical protein F5I97DRAFT_1830976 [Phlebopus sp. FC_14]
MADPSPLESSDEQRLLQSALQHPFEPADVPLASPVPARSSGAVTSSPPTEPGPTPAEEDTWKAEYDAQVREWRAQSAEAREKAERERARWEQVRLREAEERKTLGIEPESWDNLGSHITESFAAASEALSASVTSASSAAKGEGQGSSSQAQHIKTESHSPSQKWEHISSSPTSSYPSMSFPDPSRPQSPAPPPPSSPPPSAPAHSGQKLPVSETKNTTVPPSTLPSIMDPAVKPRTRMSLILSSLAINLLLPFVNGVMLGFGEIFAKNVIVGWIGWKRNGRTTTSVGLW